MSDVIAAIATAPVPSAIGILRLSGPGCAEVLDQVFTPFHGVPMSVRPDPAAGVWHSPRPGGAGH